MMEKSVYSIFTFLLVLYGNTASGFLSGPIAGRTGAPNDICDSLTCNSDACHTSYGLNTGRATFSITVPSSYEKGKTTDILITFDNSNTGLHGFEITAMDAANTKVGTFTSTSETTQTEPYKSQYAAHTVIGTAENGWTVQWTAPVEKLSDPITFYAAGNEANGDGTSLGDFIYTATATAYLQCVPATLKANPLKISVKRNKSAAITVTVTGENGDACGGITVTASSKKNRVQLEDSLSTDAGGNTIFTVKAGNEKGKDVIIFTAKSDSASIEGKAKVKIK
ncbi:MAG TPA: choice-of-anchor V domain-containing protein [Candidatus Wunengus sp. YC63]|uniref:choice-of-anchor V domain-containing protein n=1 Tax=Candidatus Wunengus sp. YC63 TaxID=3367699 RepID=UPI0040265B05